MDMVHEHHNSAFLSATVATPIDSTFSVHTQNIRQVKVVNRFTRAAAALAHVCQCRMQMQHVGCVLYSALYSCISIRYVYLIIIGDPLPKNTWP